MPRTERSHAPNEGSRRKVICMWIGDEESDYGPLWAESLSGERAWLAAK